MATPVCHGEESGRRAAGAVRCPAYHPLLTDLQEGGAAAVRAALPRSRDQQRRGLDRDRQRHGVAARPQEEAGGARRGLADSQALLQRAFRGGGLPRSHPGAAAVCAVPGSLRGHLLHLANQGPPQREYPDRCLGARGPHRLWIHAFQLPREHQLRKGCVQANARFRGRDGGRGLGNHRAIHAHVRPGLPGGEAACEANTDAGGNHARGATRPPVLPIRERSRGTGRPLQDPLVARTGRGALFGDDPRGDGQLVHAAV
mmetsp:Transcript_3168/g.7532  ORF Transcript_3168/g.7532 Transcript_3168/m.7532 type:complete len:258 (+) Transcript_3168:157-930(+)